MEPMLQDIRMGNLNSRYNESSEKTWNDLIKARVQPLDDNGFNFSGILLPEPVLESILSMLSPEDILNCNLVCRYWKDLIIRKIFWKQCYDFRGISWDSVPVHIKDKDLGWIVLCAQLRHGTFTKNHISNPSGHRQFEGWEIHENLGDQWLVEQWPAGCDRLPKDLFFGTDSSCFVSSFGWCSKSFRIDLWAEAGLNPAVSKICVPLQIKCSQMYVSRFDCGGMFDWKLTLTNSEDETIRSHKISRQLPAQMEWEKVEFSFKFKESDANILKTVRYLVFKHRGKDTQFWAGHYGMKFARACVKIECLDSSWEGDDEECNEESPAESSEDSGDNDVE